MSCFLPPEILDLIVDHLHDELATLKTCCAVSKSWVPRTRRHLFTRVTFIGHISPVECWMKTFPDPLDSPAHYARSLTILDTWLISVATTDLNRFAHSFCNVVYLYLDTLGMDDIRISLIPFHALSPAVRSLRIGFTFVQSSEIFGLVCSFPLLEDLSIRVSNHENAADRWTVPPTSPRLTGSLELRNVVDGIGPTARRLLDLPNGVHFTKIVLACVEADFEAITDLVEGCSDTLEHLDVTDYLPGFVAKRSHPIIID